jgi:hypothetical protein
VFLGILLRAVEVFGVDIAPTADPVFGASSLGASRSATSASVAIFGKLLFSLFEFQRDPIKLVPL